MAKKKINKLVCASFAITPSDIAELESWARREQRSTSSLMRNLMSRAMDEYRQNTQEDQAA
jgi:hypothetical protein